VIKTDNSNDYPGIVAISFRTFHTLMKKQESKKLYSVCNK